MHKYLLKMNGKKFSLKLKKNVADEYQYKKRPLTIVFKKKKNRWLYKIKVKEGDKIWETIGSGKTLKTIQDEIKKIYGLICSIDRTKQAKLF